MHRLDAREFAARVCLEFNCISLVEDTQDEGEWLLVGRDSCCFPPLDSRDDPSMLATLRNQEVDGARVVRHSLTTSYQTAQHLGLKNTEFALVLHHAFVYSLIYSVALFEYSVAISSSVHPSSRKKSFHFRRSSLVAIGSRGPIVRNFDSRCTPTYAKPVSEFLFIIQRVTYNEQS